MTGTVKKAKSRNINMTAGSPVRLVVLFSIPLIFGNIFQQLYYITDAVIVGKYISIQALAAVNSCTWITWLLNAIARDFSNTLSILASYSVGEGDQEKVKKIVGNAGTITLLLSVFLLVFAETNLDLFFRLFKVQAEVIQMTGEYFSIVLLGIPFVLIYNAAAALLRAVGDTRRPLYFLFAAGAVNVVLNLFFVIQLGMGVDGVGWATVISECVSAGLIIRSLMKERGAMKLHLSKLRIVPEKLKQIIRIGLPAGMQGAIFSISNVLIQSSVNSFGSIAMAGNTSSANIEGFVYTAMNAVYQTSLSFTSQNLGGKKYSRIDKIKNICLGVVTVVGLILGLGAVFGGKGLLSIYSSDPEVLAFGMRRLRIICGTYFLCGLMDCMVGSLRGLGYSVLPMIVSLTGACGFRVFWIFTIFASCRTLEVLYLSYPVSWIITASAHMFTYYKIRKRFPKKDAV